MDGLLDATESMAKTLISVVSKSAPLLGSVLGSPLAGIALSLIGSAFGASSSSVGDVLSAINGNTDAASRLKQLEYQHATDLAKIASSDYVTEVNDRINARALGSSGIYKDFMRHFAYLISVGFFVLLMSLFSPYAVPDDNQKLLWLLAGMLVSKFGTIVDFFYGSSHQQGVTKNG